MHEHEKFVTVPCMAQIDIQQINDNFKSQGKRDLSVWITQSVD